MTNRRPFVLVSLWPPLAWLFRSRELSAAGSATILALDAQVDGVKPHDPTPGRGPGLQTLWSSS
jgi:hypothetical protein